MLKLYNPEIVRRRKRQARKEFAKEMRSYLFYAGMEVTALLGLVYFEHSANKNISTIMETIGAAQMMDWQAARSALNLECASSIKQTVGQCSSN